jgi:hypothetical protein
MQFGDANARWMFARSRPIVECDQCSTRLYVPEWSEYVDPGCIRYLWHCERCDASFETVTHFETA